MFSLSARRHKGALLLRAAKRLSWEMGTQQKKKIITVGKRSEVIGHMEKVADLNQLKSQISDRKASLALNSSRLPTVTSNCWSAGPAQQTRLL